MLGDDIVDNKVPCLKQLMGCFNEYNTTIIGVQEVENKDVDKYGIVDVFHIGCNVYKVNNLVEKPEISNSPSNIDILGRYVVTPQIFDILENTSPGKCGEIQLTNALRTLSTRQAIYAYVFEGKRYDVGDKLGFIQANIEFGLKNEELKSELLNYLKSFS